jgi:hypothetical protein
MTESADPGPLADTRDLYLTLLKQALLGTLYEVSEIGPAIKPSNLPRRLVLAALRRRWVTLARLVELDRSSIDEGHRASQQGDTMIGRKRLDNVQSCVEDVIRAEIPGDLIEAGVWRGGAGILMRGVLRAHGIKNRVVWVADSFDGLPPPDPGRYPADRGDTFHKIRELAISLDTVRANFERYGLLDDQVEFLKGWFRDTLPQLAGHEWAVIRLDGDMYESTMDSLRGLHPGLSVGGYLIVDDYGSLEPCRLAVTDYRREQGIDDEIKEIDWTGVYWQRTHG